jgi:hypothetical protein
MLRNPRKDQAVLVWYRESLRVICRCHGKTGRVLAPGRGKPRNHLVEVDHEPVFIPAGNLRKVDG